MSTVTFYRVLPPQDPSKVQAFPAGLQMVAGHAMTTTAQPDYVVQWQCTLQTSLFGGLSAPTG